MRTSRFRIRTLIIAVAALAVSLAAIRAASPLWASALFTSVLGLLAFALLAVIQRSGRERAWWRGIALFGWGYLGLVYAPWCEDHVGPYLITTRLLTASHEALGSLTPARLDVMESNQLSSILRTVKPLIDQGDRNQAAETIRQVAEFASSLDADQRTALMGHIDLLPAAEQKALKDRIANLDRQFWRSTPGWGDADDYLRIGQSLFTLLVAFAGGLLGRARHG